MYSSQNRREGKRKRQVLVLGSFRNADAQDQMSDSRQWKCLSRKVAVGFLQRRLLEGSCSCRGHCEVPGT